MSFLSRILSAVIPFFLEFFWKKISTLLAEWRKKKEDEKDVQEIVDKIKNGGLKEGLEGAKDAEDRLNSNV